MAGPIPTSGPFKMPMVKSFVPKKLQPWIYLLIAASFQFVDVFYTGSMTRIMGETGMLREDVMMICYCGLIGINLPFPFLFRYKFHFTNKSLLLNAACVILICNVLTMYITWLPALCAITFVGSYFKLCGTFECMSNIQLWQTPKRDFSVFFPELYIIVLGAIQWNPFVASYVGYYFNWHVMHIVGICLMLLVIAYVATCTRHFRFMKPMPLFGMDWLGMALWAALLMEICYIFNYGEHYNWLDSTRIRMMIVAVLPTAYFCINRERHVHHPFIDPKAWKYKNITRMLLLYLAAELMAAIPNVIQNAYIEGILHYDSLHTANFNLFAFIGIILGCGFTYLWIHKLRLSYVRIIAIGFAAMVASQIMLYFIISPDINIEKFYMPTVLRNFGFAINFTALTIYMEELMPFQHFFMGLTMMGFIRTGGGQAFGGAVYSFALRWATADNTARYSGILNSVHTYGQNIQHVASDFMQQMLLISSKQIYGITCFVGVFFVLFLLMYSTPVRSTLKKMPYWNVVGRQMRKTMKHQTSEKAQIES
jgi:DHA2 family multidrug resistance protein